MYQVVYTPQAVEHLRRLTARDRATVVDTVERQLVHQAAVVTRNRKPLRENPFASWELRIGALRVYYDVKEQPAPLVIVKAVGLKQRNRIFIGGEEVEL